MLCILEKIRTTMQMAQSAKLVMGFGYLDQMLVQIPKLCLKLFILTYEAYPQV